MIALEILQTSGADPSPLRLTEARLRDSGWQIEEDRFLGQDSMSRGRHLASPHRFPLTNGRAKDNANTTTCRSESRTPTLQKPPTMLPWGPRNRLRWFHGLPILADACRIAGFAVPFREKLFPDTHFLWSPQSGNSRKWISGPAANLARSPRIKKSWRTL